MDDFSFSDDEVKETFNFTSSIIKETGPRITGDPQTHKAAKLIKSEFEKFCDSVEEETFPVHPKAFLGWIKLMVVLYILAAISLWFNLPLIAGILISIGIFAMVMEFFLYKETIDPFWKKKSGVNIVGKIEPTGQVKQQILISGHHDSAFVFNFFVHQPKLYPVRIYGGLGSVFLLWIFAWLWVVVQSITSRNPAWVLAIQIFSLVSLVFVLQMWFFRGNKGTPGAGDNLISVGIAYEVGKKIANLKKQGKGLKHTRILLCSWDAEEAGLRGARDYAGRHYKELTEIPTYNFNIDCPYYLEDFFFMTSDINGSVKLSQEMAEECSEIAKSLSIPCETKPIAFLTGGTDAGEMAKIGVTATNLMGMPWGNSQRASVYHTPQDTIESIEPQAVKGALRIIWEFIKKKEKEIKEN